MASTSNARPAKDSMSNLGRRRRAARSDGSDEYAARKQELIQIAVRVFRTKGYERTTIADIAEAAGTDRASLYYYVANKEELYTEIMNQIGRNPAAERSQSIAAEDRSAAERLRTLMVELMAAYHEQYPLLYIDLQENLGALAGDDPSDTVTQVRRRPEPALRGIPKSHTRWNTGRHFQGVAPARCRRRSRDWHAGLVVPVVRPGAIEILGHGDRRSVRGLHPERVGCG